MLVHSITDAIRHPHRLLAALDHLLAPHYWRCASCGDFDDRLRADDPHGDWCVVCVALAKHERQRDDGKRHLKCI